jgi:hypothetical protein
MALTRHRAEVEGNVGLGVAGSNSAPACMRMPSKAWWSRRSWGVAAVGGGLMPPVASARPTTSPEQAKLSSFAGRAEIHRRCARVRA